MDCEKLDVRDFAWNFTPDEVDVILDFLKRLSQLWTPEVEGLLSQLSKGVIPLSGISAAKRYFAEIKSLDLPTDSKKHVYDTLKAVSVNNLLHELAAFLEEKKKEETVISETILDLEPTISEDKQSDQVEAVSYVPRMQGTVVHMSAKSYQIDDEEYMVKSKYVHPSPTGIEEGYPPLVKKKKKVPADY